MQLVARLDDGLQWHSSGIAARVRTRPMKLQILGALMMSVDLLSHGEWSIRGGTRRKINGWRVNKIDKGPNKGWIMDRSKAKANIAWQKYYM